MWILPEMHKTGTDETQILVALFPLLCFEQNNNKNNQVFIHKKIKHILAKNNIELNWFEKIVFLLPQNENNVKNFSLVCLRLIEGNQYKSIPRNFVKKNALFLFALSCVLNNANAALFFSDCIDQKNVKPHGFFTALCNTQKKISCSKIRSLIDEFIGNDIAMSSGLLDAQVLTKAMTAGNNELLLLMASKLKFSEEQWRFAFQYVVATTTNSLEFERHQNLLLNVFVQQKSSFDQTDRVLFYALYKEIVSLIPQIYKHNVNKWIILVDGYFPYLEKQRQIFVSLGLHIRKSFQTVLSSADYLCNIQHDHTQSFRVFLKFVGDKQTNDLFKAAYLSQYFKVADRLLELHTFDYFKGFQYIKVPQEYDHLSSWRFKGKLQISLEAANPFTRTRKI